MQAVQGVEYHANNQRQALRRQVAKKGRQKFSIFMFQTTLNQFGIQTQPQQVPQFAPEQMAAMQKRQM